MSFAAFLCGAKVTSETIRPWKDDLREKNYAPSTINACLAALNGFFCFCGWTDCRARFLKIQRRLFRDSRQELTRGEYERLVAAAEATGDRGLALLMETICSTGIRVSQLVAAVSFLAAAGILAWVLVKKKPARESLYVNRKREEPQADEKQAD